MPGFRNAIPSACSFADGLVMINYTLGSFQIDYQKRNIRIVQNFIQIQAPFSFKSFILLSVSLALFLIGANLVQAQEIKGSADAGKSKVWLCTGCHSIADYRADWPVVYRVPKIGGQSSAYIVSALTAYKKGERKHPSMRGIAGSLSDQDMADIAEYYASQNANTVSNPLK